MQGEYEAQPRGSADDYARYLAGMDATMRQKVALTAAHLLCEGTVADMGTGSGAASLALARLYPRLSVVGVDISETMVALARQKHAAPNLRFQAGDAAEVVFGERALDGVLASSMLHHVTSFSGYDHDAARRAIAAQSAQLKDHGILIVRDFVDPEGGDVVLTLPTTDGDDSDEPRACSSARLFERFAREFRALSAVPGFAYERLDAVRPDQARYRCALRHATEFVLRKDYRDDWESEVKEEYTYFSQARFEAVFKELGLRVLCSTKLHNPWIIRHRYRGKFTLTSERGEVLPYPPTNYLIVGERVPPSQGVDFRPSAPLPPVGFLALEHYRNLRTGHVHDLVRRPHTTLDVVPYFEQAGTLYVLARASYPRPVLAAEPELARPLDGSRACPWAVEPLNMIQRDLPRAQSIEQALSAYATLDETALLRFDEGSTYYPSPGGVAERVVSSFVEVKPTFVAREVEARSGFSSSGRLSAIEAEQVLRAAQVGGMADARLELNVYDLLLRKQRAVGPWLGEEPVCEPGELPATLGGVDDDTKRRLYRRAEPPGTPFLSLQCRRFDELDAQGDVVASQTLEYVIPARLSAVTVSLALAREHEGTLYLALDDDDLAAVQAFEGHSNLKVTPAYRLPRGVATMHSAESFVRERLREDYALEVGPLTTLGGTYHPTSGATPEVVHPWFAAVLREGAGTRALTWVPLRELVTKRRMLKDGHLRIAALRAAHALGLLERAN